MGRRMRIAVAAVVVVAVAAGGFWYLFLRNDAPEEVSLSSAVESIQTPTVGAAATGTAAPARPTPADGLNGAWTVATGQQSFVGYRVNEELAQVGFATAVGRTPAVTGSFEVRGNELVTASVKADLSKLASDKSMRDRALRDQALETGRFPSATFVLKGPVALPATLAGGTPASLKIAGDLTLHGVTKAVEIPVDVQVKGELLVAVGSLDVLFADYQIAKPRAQAVLSVEDHGVMELQLILGRAAN